MDLSSQEDWPAAGHSLELRTGDSDRGLNYMNEGTERVWTSSIACSSQFSTSSSSDDRSTGLSSFVMGDEDGRGCVWCDCEVAVAGSTIDSDHQNCCKDHQIDDFYSIIPS